MAVNTERRAIPACCDIYEEEGKILLNMEMPGVTGEGLNINVEGDELTISGKRDTKNIPEGEYLVREIRNADYFQKFTIDSTIDREKIDAVLKDGILTVSLHIKESEKPRKITVRGA